MEKEIWKRLIWEEKCPPWPCPSCGAGVVAVVPGSFKQAPTKASIADSNEDWWGAENVVYSFGAWGKCSNALCSEGFCLSGTGTVEVGPDEQGNAQYEDAFQLRYCHPTLQLIRLPKQCPQAVADSLSYAFSLYWVDRPATAGRIRVAVERLLDHLAIPATTKKGGYLPLDHRIDAFSKNDPTNGAHLMALKWLGNVGSHTDYVNTDDLLSAFEILEHVLGEVIDKKSASIAKLAADITAKYGKS
jgi:hypothetical protein